MLPAIGEASVKPGKQPGRWNGKPRETRAEGPLGPSALRIVTREPVGGTRLPRCSLLVFVNKCGFATRLSGFTWKPALASGGLQDPAPRAPHTQYVDTSSLERLFT